MPGYMPRGDPNCDVGGSVRASDQLSDSSTVRCKAASRDRASQRQLCLPQQLFISDLHGCMAFHLGFVQDVPQQQQRAAACLVFSVGRQY